MSVTKYFEKKISEWDSKVRYEDEYRTFKLILDFVFSICQGAGLQDIQKQIQDIKKGNQCEWLNDV